MNLLQQVVGFLVVHLLLILLILLIVLLLTLFNCLVFEVLLLSLQYVEDILLQSVFVEVVARLFLILPSLILLLLLLLLLLQHLLHLLFLGLLLLVGHEVLVYFIEVVVVTRDCEDVLFSIRELVGGVSDLSEVLRQVSPLPILLHVL